MKILIAINAAFNPDSGAAGTEYQTGLHLQQLGHEVDFLWKENLSQGIRVKNGRLDQVFFLPLRMKQAVDRIAAGKHYDVLHLNQPYSFLTAISPILRRQSVIINRSHGLEPRAIESIWPVEQHFIRWTTRFHPIWGPIRWFTNYLDKTYLRIAVKYSDGVIVSSSHDRKWLLNRWNVPLEKICVIPQAPTSYFFTKSFPQTYGNDRWTTICYSGWTGITKGFHVLCNALNSLAESSTPFSFKWITNSNSHAQILDRLNLSTREHVDLLSWMSQERLVDVFDTCGIFVLPSLQEGFGKAALEAMARGLCVIVTENVGMSDLISNGENGIIIPPNNSEALVDAITRVLTNSEYAKQIGLAAREQAKKFTWERVAQETAGFYRELTQRRLGLLQGEATKTNL